MAKKGGGLNTGGANTPKNFPGQRAMSSSRSPASKVSAGSKMSSKHGTDSGNPTKGMNNAGGRVGADCKGFSTGIPERGPNPIGKKTGH